MSSICQLVFLPLRKRTGSLKRKRRHLTWHSSSNNNSNNNIINNYNNINSNNSNNNNNDNSHDNSKKTAPGYSLGQVGLLLRQLSLQGPMESRARNWELNLLLLKIHCLMNTKQGAAIEIRMMVHRLAKNTAAPGTWLTEC
ncbi:unnamed protein product [Polarella glacialis]|uniref:Uncharacterized protein n=1 Tax=Polarella glacialis TaxID=89957 RepID=A0A813F890_POLGL|nr:unnamed protein product [Polarella glacialis]